MRELLFAYGWTLFPVGVALGLVIFLLRRRARQARAERYSRRRRRNIAYQRAWDWLMGRKQLRITHVPEE